jgi:glutamyl-tRNA synthetase
MSAAAPRVRFAPSPTGYLHVGGARTALFNLLFARREGGVLILRVEDTDIARSSQEMVREILEGLSWLGITHDEGPFYQSSHRGQHTARALAMLEEGKAYRCFCTAEAIDARKRAVEQRGAVWKYDRACLALDSGESRRRHEASEPSCLRIRVPEGETVYDDLVHGTTSFNNADIEDLVLLRTDGSPTYNLSCVSDDIDMRVTHVIRGDDHISNTPKQIIIYRALGAEPPRFGHLPLILGADKKRLSKRHGAVSVMEYQRLGFLPEALFNFLALLGWSPGDDREIMTREEIIEAFSFEGVGSRSAVFDLDKLTWMNSEYLKRRTGADLATLARPWFDAEGLWRPEFDGVRKEWFHALMDLLKDRSRLLSELARDARPFLQPEFEYDPAAVDKHLKSETAVGRLTALRDTLAGLNGFDATAAETALRDLAARLGIKAGELIHPARVALTGRMVSPGIFAVMAMMGREAVVARLDRAARFVEADRAAAGDSR